jgi:hypothetical protein
LPPICGRLVLQNCPARPDLTEALPDRKADNRGKMTTHETLPKSRGIIAADRRFCTTKTHCGSRIASFDHRTTQAKQVSSFHLNFGSETKIVRSFSALMIFLLGNRRPVRTLYSSLRLMPVFLDHATWPPARFTLERSKAMTSSSSKMRISTSPFLATCISIRAIPGEAHQ